jgi:hypothetical protein
MIQELLEQLSTGGTYSIHALAEEFNVTDELIVAIMADLGRSGRIRLLDSCDQGACGGCGEAVSCKNRGKIWMLTKRESS